MLALLGMSSAADLKNLRSRHAFVQQRHAKKGPMYPETKEGAEWFELDDHSERIHGTHENDDLSPYDPDVVDAPEDMLRTGNDHTPLHNAKLSPDGYYNGFHHKDFEGNYVQRSRRGHLNNVDYLQYDHENDTEDIPEGQDPVLAQRGNAQQKIRESGAWDNYFKESKSHNLVQENDEESWDQVQSQLIQIPHEDDTEDIVSDLNPVAYDKMHSKQWNAMVERKAEELEK